MQISGNTLLITGGGSGIGRGLAEAFHQRGNQVVICGRSEGKLKETTAANPGMEYLVLDVTNGGDVFDAKFKIKEHYPELNVLINNAGVMYDEDVQAGETEAAEATIQTNLLGPIRLTAALLPLLQLQPSSTVMNVTSGLAFVPLASAPTYSATKAALHSYTETLRTQLADTVVQVIELAPPYVQTYLQGEQQANDPNAMPLDDYISESMRILEAQPEVEEILVEGVKPLRHAERDGNYEEVYAQLTEMVKAREEQN